MKDLTNQCLHHIAGGNSMGPTTIILNGVQCCKECIEAGGALGGYIYDNPENAQHPDIVFFKFYTDLDRITAILCSFVSCLAIYKILGILDGYLNKPSNK
ncbi:hypothetical protein [Glaesserella sp.]|uniref:hypothetical protein n=1 Tax=Glaesserella sp. TaxID=2094731 RepID=UPI0035A05633